MKIPTSHNDHSSRREFLKRAAGAACAMAGTSAVAQTQPTSNPASHPASHPQSDDYFQRDARWWRAEAEHARCLLCPHHCIIPENERGLCGVREYRSGRLITLVYGRACRALVANIEERHLWHFLPGEKVLTLAANGCNLACRGCNEWGESQCPPDFRAAISAMPEDIPQACKASNCETLAFDITEPVIAFEWLKDALVEARRAGLKTVVGSNGYISPEPLSELLPHLSAIKIDLKGFDDRFYSDFASGQLAPVLDALLQIKGSGIWLEIAWPVIPGGNDGEEKVIQAAQWILENLGPDVPLHFLRHSPDYRLRNIPETPRRTLTLLRKLCMREGLRYVYISGVEDHEGRKTYCPNCYLPVVLRAFNRVESGIDKGQCGSCRHAIAGVWKTPTINLGSASDSIV